MAELHDYLKVKVMPNAHPKNIITGKGWRITVLTERLLRVEKQKKGVFTDEATQYIWNRNFPEVKFTVEEQGRLRLITTSWAKYYFDPMSQKITSVFLNGNWVSVKRAHNFGGTCRTLDNTIGRVPLEDGLAAEKGVAVLKDNGLLLVDGQVQPRKAEETDEYIFAYGRNYRDAVADYFFMTGGVPMLPRYVLGNWWSRYYAYTQQEYLDLMNRFEKEKIPLTVATFDMDWHWVQVNKHFSEADYGKYGWLRGGWTGYSWNTDLFPDRKQMLKELHEKNLHVTLNLHPAQGVRCFEDKYAEMATAMGMNPAEKKTVPFDITNPTFINRYFDILHHPLEEEGVDFWWIDWQQGKKSGLKGLDPLWSLNHYHYLDSARNGKRGLILSRYCGIGSHRYPIGFSGDTFCRWSALKFQPEFTNKAANIGYGWWSHDIGGHTMGFTDDEMYIRWCQYGTFSPINRLHSSMNELQVKEPWKHSSLANKTVGDYLRLRHALIPYLYTENRRSATLGTALCQPMYHTYPEKKGAYKVPNQYTFGTELIVSPIVEKRNKADLLSAATVWLPSGYYTDIFTGRRYEGGRKIKVFRETEQYPVFAKEGAIIPLSADEGNGCDNPRHLRLWVYRGTNSYTLYEDDGISDEYKNGKYAETTFSVAQKEDRLTFKILPTEGELSVLPEKRKILLCFKDLCGGKVFVSGKEVPFAEEIVIEADYKKGCTVIVDNPEYPQKENPVVKAKEILSRYQAGNHRKLLYSLTLMGKTEPEALKKAVARNILFPKHLREAALEAFLP